MEAEQLHDKLRDIRAGQSERYRHLNQKAREGISALTPNEVIELENLRQLGIITKEKPGKTETEVVKLSEFDRSLNGERLWQIERSRIAKAKQKVNEGKAPFEQTYFNSWEWDSNKKVYIWKGAELPKDSQAPLVWKPDLEPTSLEQSTSDPESRS